MDSARPQPLRNNLTEPSNLLVSVLALAGSHLLILSFRFLALAGSHSLMLSFRLNMLVDRRFKPTYAVIFCIDCSIEAAGWILKMEAGVYGYRIAPFLKIICCRQQVQGNIHTHAIILS